MKKHIIIRCGYAFPRAKRNPFGQYFDGNLALYRQYEVGGFNFEIEIFNRYAIIKHIRPIEDFSIDLLHNTSNRSILEAKRYLMDFLLKVRSIYGVYEEFTPFIWGN